MTEQKPKRTRRSETERVRQQIQDKRARANHYSALAAKLNAEADALVEAEKQRAEAVLKSLEA